MYIPCIGSLVNAAAIVAGTMIGMFFKGGIPERLRKMVFTSVGVAVMFIGIMGVMDNKGNAMLLVLSLVLGGLIGEAVDFEAMMERTGEALKKRFVKEDSPQGAGFVEGFVSASVIFLVGAMAIVGSLNDGLLHDPSMLFTKAILDGVTSLILAASLGVGVAFSALPILIYQGGITLLAGVLAPYMTDELIRNMSFVGNAVIFCIGVNFLWPGKVRAGNLFPSMFMPVILLALFGGFLGA